MIRKSKLKESYILIYKKAKGITLIALVITIVILLILAGITTNFILDENGLIDYAKKASDDTYNAGKEEELMLKNIYEKLELSDIDENINIQDLNIGWNLGNSLDCADERKDLTVEEYETLWNNPVTTKEMIKTIKESGFSTIRIPVTWFNHVDENNNIKQEWMTRVKEVVDYAMDCDMYVILNTHHDDNKLGLENNSTDFEQNIIKYKKIWEQIANTFKDYPYNLVFELLNEPIAVVDGEEIWNTDNQDYYNNLNNLMYELLNTVRNTGNNNSNRYILITTYGGSISSNKLKNVRIPDDEHIALAISAYIDYDYCTSNTEVLTDDLKESIRYNFQLLKDFSETNNIPILIKETGAYKKEDRDEWIKMIYLYAGLNDIPILWWDDGSEDSYSIFDRNNLRFFDENAVNIIKETTRATRNLDNSANIIDSINYTKNVETSNTEEMGIRVENGKNHYYVNGEIASSIRFKFSDSFNLNNEGIYQFSCKIKTNMDDLDLKYVMNFYDNSGTLIYKKDYSSFTSDLIDGSKEIYNFNTLIYVENAYKVELERVHVSSHELQQIDFEIYDFSLKGIDLN